MEEIMYRQGDILITKLDVSTVNGELVESGILAKGEVSGHTHRLVGGQVFTNRGDLYLVVKDKATVVHEEHDTIELPSGFYAVKRQREYVSKEEERTVND